MKLFISELKSNVLSNFFGGGGGRQKTTGNVSSSAILKRLIKKINIIKKQNKAEV